MTTALTTGDILLRDIIDHPKDKGLRSIYADWLEEYGGRLDRHKAELIRYDKPVRLATYDKEDWTFHHDDRVHDRGDGYRKLCIARTHLRSSSVSPKDVLEVEYRCGFIEVIKAPLDVLVKGLPQWVALYPLTEVEVSDKEPTKSGTHKDKWFWYNSEESSGMTDGIPQVIWVNLGGEQTENWSPYRRWNTPKEAVRALSDTLLEMARKEVL